MKILEEMYWGGEEFKFLIVFFFLCGEEETEFDLLPEDIFKLFLSSKFVFVYASLACSAHWKIRLPFLSSGFLESKIVTKDVITS